MQSGLAALSAVLLGLVVNLLLVSPLTHEARQDAAYDTFRLQLAEGTAPVSEIDGDGRLLASGSPVALVDIPSIGVHEVVVEGTTSGDLVQGPGHRRDTVLPGQQGTSVLMGRAGAYGGPFGDIEQLAPGDTFTVTTGQGEHTYRVLGVRYAKDPSPPPPSASQSRLVLTTARGPAFMPTGVARVDAELVSKVYPAGQRVTTALSRGPAGEPMAADTSTLWALVLWLQVLVALALGAVWSFNRWGRWQTWVVFVPSVAAVGFQVADQVTWLLPNML
ncbi:sortase [Planotetraspora thailandica]|nr:class E sortase [Planotetraspora thailandica]